MAIHLTDAEIQSFIQEPKELRRNLSELALKEKVGHKEYDFDIEGNAGSQFRVIIRQSKMNMLSFSVILAYMGSRTSTPFRLRRYNGKAHWHTNVIEKDLRFYDFHIHEATQRYQAIGFREDFYATRTDRFTDIRGAFECFISDCNIITPDSSQLNLFGSRL